MSYFLVKSESSCYSIDDLKRDGKTLWTGVRNYQARNFLKSMLIGDEVLYYHSNDNPIGIVGIAKVIKIAEMDPTQFDKNDDHYDSKALIENPIWFCPTIAFVEKFKNIITRDILICEKKLAQMKLLQKGSRLSVLPVTKEEFMIIKGISKT